MIVGDFSVTLSILDRNLDRRFKKEINHFSNTMKELNLKHLYRTYNLTIVEYSFLNWTWNVIHGRPCVRPWDKFQYI